SETPVSGGGTQFVQNLELDLPHNWIYYTEGNKRSIRRVRFDGTSDEQVVAGTSNGPVDIALDIPAGKMYWTQIVSTASQLFRSNLDGTGTELLFGDQGFYYDLAIDPANGFIYFADQHPNYHAIRRVKLDGTQPTVLVTAPGLQPSGLEIDLAEQK